MAGALIAKTGGALALAVSLVGFAWGGPTTALVKAADRAYEAATPLVKGGARVAGHAAVGSGTRSIAKIRAGLAAKRAAESASTTERIVKNIRPGQVLAVGGAIAAVDAAHQISDGVQTATQEAGKTGGVILCIGVALAVVLFAVVLACRQRRRLPTATEAEKKEQKPEAPAVVMPSPLPFWRSVFLRDNWQFWVKLLWLTILVFVGCWILSPRSARAGILSAWFGGETPYEQENARLYRQFTNDLAQVASIRFGQLRERVPGVVRDAGSFVRLVGYVKKAAQDKACGGTRLDEALRHDFGETILETMAEIDGEVERLYAAYAEAIRENALKYGKTPPKGAYRLVVTEDLLSDVDGDVSVIDESLDGLERKQNVAAIAGVIEACFARATARAFMRLAGRAVAKVGLTATFGVACAAADGPLPIGDIVTVGCAGATAFDIYAAYKAFPDEIKRTINSVIVQNERLLVQVAISQASVLAGPLSCV